MVWLLYSCLGRERWLHNLAVCEQEVCTEVGAQDAEVLLSSMYVFTCAEGLQGFDPDCGVSNFCPQLGPWNRDCVLATDVLML